MRVGVIWAGGRLSCLTCGVCNGWVTFCPEFGVGSEVRSPERRWVLGGLPRLRRLASSTRRLVSDGLGCSKPGDAGESPGPMATQDRQKLS